MIGRVGIGRRLAAILGATPLLLALALAWQIRPPLPPWPHSLLGSLPAGTGIAVVHLLTWLVFVALDLVLFWEVLLFGSRRQPTEAELRLRRAVRWPPYPKPASASPPDWRAFAAPPAQPVMYLTAAEATDAPPPRPLESVGTRTDIEQPTRKIRAGPPLGPRTGRIGLRLLGPLELLGCEKTQPRRKATGELLAFLALQHGPVNREELVEALWPGDEQRRSAERFHQAVTEARRLLGDGFQRHRDNYYELDRRRLWIDVDALDQLRKQAEAAGDQEQRLLYEQTLALFTGTPFVGIETLWAEAEGRRLLAVQSELLERLGWLRLQAGEASGALAAAEQASLLDSSNEKPIQLAMAAEAALGHRDAIVGRYERLSHELDEQFGLEPSRETKQLYRQLLSQDTEAPVHIHERERQQV